MMRREFLGVATGIVGTANVQFGERSITSSPPPTVRDWRAAFPALSQRIEGHPLAYLDTAATSLRPQPVIDAVAKFYSTDNANPAAALHTLARRANAAVEGARASVASFIGASDPLEVTFTRGTTDGLNLVASAWGDANVHAGDEILIGMAEHASNMLPWRYLARRSGARLVYFDVDDGGRPRIDDLVSKLSARTRIVAFSHVSNVLGMINPVREMCTTVRGPGRIVVIDGAQSVPHVPVNVQDLGCDFMAFSSHKMCGPMGVGVLWGRRELLEAMPPYQTGSNMAHDVGLDALHLSAGALKFGAGTPNASGPVGLAAAMAFLRGIGFDALAAHEQAINRRMLVRLARIPQVRLLGSAEPQHRVSVFSFAVKDRTPLDVMRTMDAQGIAIRAGDLASLPLLQRFGENAVARASCYLYTTEEEIDRFADTLEQLIAS